MKKKKLKKEIKKLREELALVIRDGREAFDNQSNRINNLGDRYTKLRGDFNNLEQKLTSKADANGFQINDIYEKLKILKLRTETDYTQFKPLVDTSKGPNDAPPTCETCRWKGLDVPLGPDSPCYGCTKEDKKMYEPITHTEEPNGQ